MSESRSGNAGDDGGRLHRCIRDLAALNALPSMCIGRSPEEALAIVADALPTALNCDLVYLWLPGSPPRESITLGGAPASDEAAAVLRSALGDSTPFEGTVVMPGLGAVYCHGAEVPLGSNRGRLIAGRTRPMEVDTDRVLVRSAANLVGTALESADVLEAARQKDEFLALLGHELRNPLAPILTAIELVNKRQMVAREHQVIERNTRHLVRLVDDLLDISRVTRGHIELREENVSLSSVLEGALEIATPLINRHRHSVSVSPSADITLHGDAVRLAQIFGNLLTNAAKFTPPGGVIEVSIERVADRVRVAVRDNGRGIPVEQLGRIFQPFVQIERERDSLQGGLGLGLAIVADLVNRHRGTIAVHSDGAGKGCVFTVDLPTVAAQVPVAIAPAPRSATVRAGCRVLVVDDNVDIAELLSDALRGEGFETAIAHDARAALERWTSFVPHAAVLDVGLPEMDGYQLAKALRAQHGPDPTLIAATGYGQRKDRREAVQAGFDCHFVKPVSIEDLVRVLDERVLKQAPA